MRPVGISAKGKCSPLTAEVPTSPNTPPAACGSSHAHTEGEEEEIRIFIQVDENFGYLSGVSGGAQGRLEI